MSSDSEDDEDFMAAKMASMLSNYYGTVGQDEGDNDEGDHHHQQQQQDGTDGSLYGGAGTASGAGAGAGGGRRHKSATHSSSSMAGGFRGATEDIDSSSFDPSEYAVNMLQNESLAGLLERDATLVREIKSIDTDMKMLVHENYNKFISATDTIRSMRHNVDEMEEKMEELKQDMDSIYGKAEEITVQLAPARTKIEKLVSVRQLLKKLEFLFELPLRLSRSIELKAYEQAVKYYSTARGVLNDHLDVPSFQNILVEADAIISKLKADIQTWIQADDISAPKLAQYIKLLLSLDLDEDNSALLHIRYLEWHRRRLNWMLHRHSLEVSEDDLAERPEPDGWPFEALPVDAFVASLKRSVVQGFVDMCHMYVGIFGYVGDLDVGNTGARGRTGGSARGGAGGDLHPDLLQFGADLFLRFFALCKQKILSSPVDLALDDLGGASAPHAQRGTNRRGNASGSNHEPSSLDTLSAALHALQQCAQLIHQVLPRFRAHDRLAETLEHAVRHRIQEVFKSLHNSTLERLLAACARADPHKDRSGAPADTTTADGATVRLAAEDIVGDVGRVLASLRPLVEIGTESSIMSAMPRIFSDLVQGQLHHFFLWFNSAVQALTENDDLSSIIQEQSGCRGGRAGDEEAEGLAESVASTTDAAHLHAVDVSIPSKPHIQGASAGVALLLACVSKRFQEDGVSHAHQMLTDNLPYLKREHPQGHGHNRDPLVASGDTGDDVGMGVMADLPGLMKRARATTKKLLNRYVHLLVEQLAEGVVRAHFESVDWLRHGEPREVSEYCTACFSALGKIVEEVRRLTGATDFELSTIPRRPVFKLPSGGGAGSGRHSDAGGRGGSGGSGAAGGGGSSEPGIRLNIERLFTQKLSLYENISFRPQSIIEACLTVTLKTLYEVARTTTFAKFGYQQAQIDASFLRVMLPRFGVRMDSGLDDLLNEFVSTVHARCVAPSDVDIAVVDSMIRSKRDELGV